MDFTNIYKNILTPIQQGISGVNNLFMHPIQSAAQSVENFIKPQNYGNGFTPPVNRPATPNYHPQVDQPNARPALPLVQSYMENQIRNPLQQGSQALLSNKTNILQKGLGGLQIAQGVTSLLPGELGLKPFGLGFNLESGAVAGGLKTLRTGQPLQQTIPEGITQNPSIAQTGLGIKNPLLAFGVDTIANPESLIKGSKGINNIVQGIKGLSPNAFSIHPDDQRLLGQIIDTFQTEGKLNPNENKTLQTLTDHYLGQKYSAQSTKKITDTFDAILSNQNGGLKTKIPAVSNLVGEAKAPEVTNPTDPFYNVKRVGVSPEPLPWEGARESLPPKEIGTTFTNEPVKPQSGEASLNPQFVAQQARLAHSGATENITFKAGNLASQMDRVLKTPQDNLNIRLAIENPSKLEEYANKSNNPQAFKEVAKQYSNFTDSIAQQAKDSGNPLGFVDNYFTHIWDLSTPEAQKTYQDLMTKNAKNFESGFTKERVVDTIQQGLKAGLSLKNQNASQDVLEYAKSMGTQVAASAFNKRINELRPGGAIEGNAGSAYNFQKKPFLQSNVPGNQGTLIDPEIQKHMSYYNPSVLADNPVVQTADRANRALKTWDLSFGGFHALKTTARALTVDPTIIPSAVKNALSPAARDAFNQKAIENGVIDYGTKVGVTFSGPGDLQGKGILTKINPIEKANESLFKGLINTYKVNAVRRMMSKFDLSNPEQAQQAQKYGSQINNLFGGLNYEALGRNKTVQQILRFGVLASDFNEGKVRQIATAANLNDWSKGAIFARQTLLGEAAVFAIVSELGRRLVTGKFDSNLNDFVNHAILNPGIPLPNSPLFNNPKTGATQIAFTPGSDIADINRARQDPMQFIQARGAQLPKLVSQIASGKDYYGQNLVQGNQEDNLINRTTAALKQNLPIPGMQGVKVAQGKTTPLDAVINTLGGRVANNPDDPKVQATLSYFNSLNSIAKGLDTNQQKTFLGTLHPTKKDPEGNPIADKTPYTKPAQFAALLNDPKLLGSEIQFQQSQPNHHPMWDLQPTQLKPYLQEQLINGVDPGGDKLTVNALKSVLPQGFQDQVSQYYRDLTAKGIQVASNPNQMQQPKPPDSFQGWQSLKNQGLSTGRYLQSHPELIQYFQSLSNYTNAQRADMGLPLLASQQYGSYKGRTRSYVRSLKAPKASFPKVKALKQTNVKAIRPVKQYALKPIKVSSLTRSTKKGRLAL